MLVKDMHPNLSVPKYLIHRLKTNNNCNNNSSHLGYALISHRTLWGPLGCEDRWYELVT